MVGPGAAGSGAQPCCSRAAGPQAAGCSRCPPLSAALLSRQQSYMHASSRGLANLVTTTASRERSGSRQPATSRRPRAAALGRSLDQVTAAASVAGEEVDEATARAAALAMEGRAEAPASRSLVVAPEDFVLAPGELSEVDRTSPASAADTYMCAGCTRLECQGPSGCAANAWRFEEGGYLRQILTARVYDVAVKTPLELASSLSEGLGVRLMLKREDLQPVFSFKLRGAYNRMAQLSAAERAAGVVCSSAGNHAQGVALAARELGCSATICMPVTTPEIKVSAVRRLGGTVQLVGESYQETQAAAQALSATEGRVFIAPYDDPYTVAGQGTIGAEVLRQLGRNVDELEAVFVAVGGGGLIAGVASYLKALKPNVKIIGVEPAGANAMAQSLARGERVVLSKVDSFADGVAVKQVGAETFRMCRELVDGCVLVDNSAISAAIKDVFNETRCILEPAGAVAVAGAKAYCKRHALSGVTVVAVTSGANINFDRLRLVSELASVGARQEAMLTATIPEQPGAFKRLLSTATEGTDIQVTEFKYRYSVGSEAHILFSVGISCDEELAALLGRLRGQGFDTEDISNLEAAQVHLRHLVGGRARSYTGTMPHERIFQVDFPERPGALRGFLDAVSPRWNVTLFHYRNTGNRSSTVLVGIQVPPEDAPNFSDASAQLADFTFTELSEQANSVFRKFIA